MNISSPTIPFMGTMSLDVSSSPASTDAAKKIKNQLSENKRQVAKTEEEQNTTISAKELKQVATEMNEIMDDLHTSLGFSIREGLHNQVIVEIKNRETSELIKQIPSEELLAIKEKMEELTGLLLDHRV
ncbi:MAG: hypothetical protein A3J85_07390 [Desulfobacula sp. RIFOXYA12_FULL_46_16]|nr:MAG: hypothetical protein A3J85_07390 [Desulfobacula sp. RIFOXYA12_FULL_46_16]OGR41814.1 MAG: hypothetical protein A3J80_09720 [Desulfobacula sp. RIFOXYB2_FULL_45_6]